MTDRPAGLLLRERLTALETAETADDTDWRGEAVRVLDREVRQQARRAEIAALRALLDAGAPSGGLDGLLDAVRAYGDARADVAYGRATRKAIDLAWDGVLAAGRIPPMDARLAEQSVPATFDAEDDPGETP